MKEIVQKIKNLFKNLFRINKTKCLDVPKNDVNIEAEKTHENIINSFIKDMKLENDEIIIAKNIQQKYKNGEIQLQDMSKEDKDKLISLYLKQINNQIKEISEYQNKLISITNSNN